MEDLRGKALDLIRGQQKIERVVKRCRVQCVVIALALFAVGFLTGAAMPFQLKAVPIPVQRTHGH